MTNVANKYSTILDALDYAHNVDAEKPNDINIISAIGGIYFDKLGNPPRRFTTASAFVPRPCHTPATFRLRQRDIGMHRTKLDAVLDSSYHILPELLKPRLSQPLVDPHDPSVVYDGSELQFLAGV